VVAGLLSVPSLCRELTFECVDDGTETLEIDALLARLKLAYGAL